MKNKITVSILTTAIVLMSNFCCGFLLKVPLQNTAESTFCGSGSATEQSETIYYSRKETEEYKIKGEVPGYISTTDTGCANLAGAVIIGYYDRLCENLIPNYKTYIQIGSLIKYKEISVEVANVITELKDLMGTDKGVIGTTFTGYQQGMRAYVTNHNYTYSTEDLGKLNLDKYKTAVQSNKPVAIFLSNYSILLSDQDDGTSETIKYSYDTVPHVVVGFGYKIETYFNANNAVIATRTYLKVASGLTQVNLSGISYLCLDGKSKIEYAISTTIQ